MDRKPNQADQHEAKSLEADETTISLAWQEQVAQASSSAKLAAELRQAPPTLYRRFAVAYRDLLALSRARRRKLLRSMGMSLAGAALAFALALGQVPIARAAGIGVGGSCTLIDAITAANTDTAVGGCAAGSGADTITLSGDVTLTSVNSTGAYGDNGLPLITSAITIEGNGATISRVGGSPDFRIFEVASTGDLTLNDTTISGGRSSLVFFYFSGSGGGILNSGTLTLTNSTVSDNTIGGFGLGGGGGIENFGMATLNNSTVSGNAANSGGGIDNSYTMTLNNSTVSGNTAYSVGGGIMNNATLTLNNSTVNVNSGSAGGAIFNNGSSTLTVNNSTLSGNTVTNSGGAISNSTATVTLTNSTLSGNSAASNGGAIVNFGTLSLERSLVAGNSAGSSAQEIYTPVGTVNSANNNLFGHSGESNAQAFDNFTPSGSDITATSDGTTPTALASILDTTLANNGGPTLAHALVTGSPALDAAPSGPSIDQRGVARPQGADFDIGAFELVQNSAPVANNDSYSTGEDTALSVPAPGVLGNDSDADSDPLTAVLVSGPAHGTLTLNPDGSFSYTPTANYSGADSFSYKANDGTADSNVATVSLTVVSAADQIEGLIGDVQALVDNGTLSPADASKLFHDLSQAQKHLDKGQVNVAINMLSKFITDVTKVVNNGGLPAAEGQALIDAANAVIDSLGG